MPPFTIAQVNAMPLSDFVAAFGDVAEHSPWVAEAAEKARPFSDREDMIAAFAAVIQAADRARQRDLLLAHPDLAGRAAIAGELTADSRREQAGAGLDRLTPEEFARFSELNAAYRARHGIPFILAVRGATKNEIIAACAARTPNDPDEELRTAIAQVCRIVRFRLEDRVRG
jgi:2-oxo-4-hydroxy-4-carboxy-5-ureidoimidazoline decarboxylase